MKTGPAIADILKKEGVEYLFAYPVNHLIEACAAVDIRPIIVRQERIGLHMADAMSRLTKGRKMGVFCMQSGPGSENAYGGVAQAFGESVPLLVIPQGYPRRIAHVPPNFNSTLAMAHVAKHAEPITNGREIVNIMRRAFNMLRNGRGAPVIIELPADAYAEDAPDPLGYEPVVVTKYGPDAGQVAEAAKVLMAAKRPVIYAGQGVHWAEAYAELKELAELLAIPVCTSLEGKSCFDETHPLALGSGGRAYPKAGAPVPRPVRRDPGHRLLVHRDQLRHLHAEGQDDHPCHARPCAHQQGRAGEVRPGRRRQADTGRADLRSQGRRGDEARCRPPSRPRSSRSPTSG